MSCIYNQIHLTEKEFEKQFDVIMDSINEETTTIWIIDHRVMFIPIHIYNSLKKIDDDIKTS